MGIWSIYRNSGQAPNMIAVCDSLEYHGEWMGDCFLTVSVKSPTPVTFRVGDYVEYRGEKYYIDYDPNTIKKAESGTYKEGFTYDGIKLYSEFHALSDIMMKDYVLNDNGLAYSQQANFSFFASSVEDLADRIQANLDKATKGQNWKVVTPNADRSEYRNGGTDITASERRKYYGASPDGGYTDVNVVCNSIMLTDAVKMAYDLFGLSFIVTDRRIIIGGTPQPVSSSLSYGKGYGLYEVEKVTDESQRVVTKMYAYGSSDNLPLNYYANLHKQYKATVSNVDKSSTKYYYCEFTLRMSYKPSMFTEVCKWTDSSGNTYNNMGYVVKIKLGSTEITARVNNPKDSTDGLVHIYAEYVAGSEDPSDEPNPAKMSAFITSLAPDQTIYFTAGIDKNRWPTSGIDYGDSANYPALLSISNLMLPGFPDQSLYEWVASHGGTGLNESSGQATYNGHTAYFSKEKMSPWIMSVKADTLGEREGAVYFDGSSNDTENIHPTIESTGGNVVTYGSSITDNGYLADNTDLSFSIEITAAGDLDWRELYNSRQEDAYLNMKIGYCKGRAFKILSLPKKTGSSWTVKLERSKDGSLDRYFPYQDMSATYSQYAQIRKNDTFVATGIQLPKDYVDAASKKLLEAALERLEAIDHPKQTYIPKIDELWAARDYDKKHTTSSDKSLYTNIYPGMNFSFEDADVLGAGVTMTRVIDSLTIKEDGNNGIPTFDIVLREEKEETFEQRVQSQMSSGSSGSGKSSSGQGITEDDIDSYVDGMMKVDMFSKLFEVHGKIKDGKLDVNGTDTKIGYKDWKEVFDDDDAKWKTWETEHAKDKKPYESLLNIKAKRGLWSEFFISALGVGGSGTGTPFELNELLNSLNNIKSLPTTVGHTIVWDGSGWYFDKAGGGEELGDVLQNIKDNSPNPGDRDQYKTLEYDGANWTYGYLLRRLNVTNHKESETTGYPSIPIDITGPQSEINLYQILNDYLKQDDADDRYVKIDWFKSLFKVHTGANDAAGTEIEPNKDLPSDGGFNIESLVGFWTKKWVSALGANGSGSGGGTAFDLSPILADINMSPLRPTAAGALYYNGSAGSWSFVQLNPGIDETALQNYLDDKKYIKGDTNTKWWGRTMGSDKLVKGDMTDVGSIIMSGNISYKGTKATKEMIRFVDNKTDDYGNGIAIGGGGLVVIGGGESSAAMLSQHASGGDENLLLGNDGGIDVFTNLQDGWAKRKEFTFFANGGFKADRYYLYKPNANNDIGAIYLEYDNNSTTPGVHLVGAGLWSDSFISALGSNPTQGTGFDPNRLVASLNDSTLEPLGVSGKVLVNNNGTWSWEDYGAGGGLDVDAMWAALGGTGDNKIDNSHLSLKSLTFKAGASDTTGVAYSPTDNAGKTITFDAAANSGISVTRSSDTITIGNTEISGLTEGSYTKVTVDKYGRVIAGEKPTTLEGYGITDAKIDDGVITLGSNTITPLTDAKIKSDYTWWGQKLNANGIVSGRINMVASDIYWKENNYGDQFSIGVDFNNTDDYNRLCIKSAVGGQGEVPTLGTKVVITGKSGNVGIGVDSPSYKLDISGTVNATEFRAGGNYITTHTTSKYLKVVTDKNELYIGRTNVSETSPTLHINNKSLGSGESAVADYQWHAGASTSWASHRVGKLYFYKAGDTSSSREVYLEIDDNGDVRLNGNFYATGAVSALGSKDSGGQDYFNADLMWQELSGSASNHVISNSHLDLSDYALQTDLSGFVKSIKVGDQTKTPNANGLVDLGSIAADGYITPIASGQANTAKGDGKVWFKRASVTSDGTPNNGFVIEYGTSTNWVGQLYLGDNATQGLYWNGWNDGVRGSWKKIAFTSDLEGYAKTSDFKSFSIKVGQNAVTTYKPSAESSITFKAGANISLDTTTANQIEIKNTYTLPSATANALGGVKVSGNGLKMDGDVLKVDDLSGTYALKTQLSNYLPLIGGTLSGSLNVKYSSIDATKNGNNVTTTQYPTSFSIIDNGNRIITRTESVVEPESNSNGGRIGWYSYVRQYDSTHTTNSNCLAQRGIKYMLSKSLVGTWYIDDAPSFRSALGINIDNLVTTNTDQTITGAKTFSSLLITNNVDTTGRIKIVHNISGVTWASDNGAISIRSSASGNSYSIGIAANTDGYTEIQSSQIGVGAKPLVLQKNLGNVGIGTTEPSSRLHVNGTFYASGDSSIGGKLLVGASSTNFRMHVVGGIVAEYDDSGSTNYKGSFRSLRGNFMGSFGVNKDGYTVFVTSDEDGNNGTSIMSLTPYNATDKYALFPHNVRVGNANNTTVDGAYVKIGGVYLIYDQTNNAIRVSGSSSLTDNTNPANIYAVGGVSALGSGSSGGGSQIELTGLLAEMNGKAMPSGSGALYYSGGTWSFQTLNQGDNLSEPLSSLNGRGNPTGSGKQMLYYENGWKYMSVPNVKSVSGLGISNNQINVTFGDGTSSSNITVPYATKAGSADSATSATSAGKLSENTAYKAWGQTFFTGGKPQSVSGRLSMVASDIYWKENGFGDQFAIAVDFNNVDDYNRLYIKSATGGSGTSPDMTNKVVVTGKSGNVGIGVDSPSCKLHVSGTGCITGGLIVGAYTQQNHMLYVAGSGLIKNNLTISNPDNTTNGAYIKIGGATLTWDGSALKCDKDFYSTGAVSALGSNTSGGGGGISDISVSASLSGTILTINVSGQTGSVNLSSISGGSDVWHTSDFSLKSYTSVQALGWSNNTADATRVVTSNALAYWNGLYDNNSSGSNWHSNLEYCKKGKFGSIVTFNESSFGANIVPDGNNNRSLGSSSNRWGTIYCNKIDMTGSQSALIDTYNIDTYSIVAQYINAPVNSSITFSRGNVNFSNNIGVGGNASGDYALYVSGNGYFTNNIYFGANDTYITRWSPYSGSYFLSISSPSGLVVNGTASWSSDIRKKDVVKYLNDVKLDDIAKAPIFDFKWKDNRDGLVRVGTSAQYWQSVIPNSVMDLGVMGLSLDYNAISVVSAVITARKVVDHELRIKQLEQENEILRKEIEELKAA